MASILIVDDQENFRFSLSVTLKREGHRVSEVPDGKQAVQILSARPVDILVTDLRMPGMDGIALLQEAKKISSQIEVIVMTAFGSVDTAVEAMRHGACDYITKPFQPEELILVVKRTLERLGLAKRVRDLESLLGESFKREGIIGQSKAVQEILSLVSSISHSEGTVLVSGESGTGKELVARAVHSNSPRRERPFVTLNCAALPDTLQESEMFGYTKGAFTGAVRNKPGLIEEADGGTLFLDEIALASPSAQSKLLRFLQHGEFRRLGDTQERYVDVRLIAATNSDLLAAIKSGAFRQDLYYRLNVIPIHLPPLRERMEDVPLLAEHFFNRFISETSKEMEGFEPAALELLSSYDWPGNVRELENAIEYSVMVSPGPLVSEEALPPQVRKSTPSDGTQPLTLEEVEARHIAAVLESTDWNHQQAAGVLGIGRTTLWRKVKSYGLSRQNSDGRSRR